MHRKLAKKVAISGNVHFDCLYLGGNSSGMTLGTKLQSFKLSLLALGILDTTNTSHGPLEFVITRFHCI